MSRRAAPPPRRRPLSPAEAGALFAREWAPFGRAYPRTAPPALWILDRPCGPAAAHPGGCGARDVAWCARVGEPARRCRVVLLARALALPRHHVVGVLRHEFGHLCDPRFDAPGPGAEQRADDIAAAVTGRRIAYDPRLFLQTTGPGIWPRPPHLHR